MSYILALNIADFKCLSHIAEVLIPVFVALVLALSMSAIAPPGFQPEFHKVLILS